jgi:hypothetical protein
LENTVKDYGEERKWLEKKMTGKQIDWRKNWQERNITRNENGRKRRLPGKKMVGKEYGLKK